MRTSNRLRTILVLALASTLLLTTGCGGNMAMESIKEGVYNYVSGSFTSGIIADQLAGFLGDLAPGSTTNLTGG